MTQPNRLTNDQWAKCLLAMWGSKGELKGTTLDNLVAFVREQTGIAVTRKQASKMAVQSCLDISAPARTPNKGSLERTRVLARETRTALHCLISLLEGNGFEFSLEEKSRLESVTNNLRLVASGKPVTELSDEV